jgi:hypothetical protein
MINKDASVEASGLYNAINAAGAALNATRDTLVQSIETTSDADKTAIYGMDVTTDLGGYTPWGAVRDRVKQAFAVVENFTGADLGYDTRVYELANETLHYISPVTSQAKTFRQQIITFRNNLWQIADYADHIIWLDSQGQSAYITSTFGIANENILTVRDRLSGAMKYARNKDNTTYAISASERPYLAATLWQTILRP